MKEKAASCARAMRWPGGGRATRAPARRRQGWKRRRAGQDGVQVQAALRHVGQPGQAVGQVRRARRPAPGRGGAPAGRGWRRAGWRRARAADAGQGLRDAGAVALAADAVEHHAADAHRRVEAVAKPRATAAAVCAWPDTSSTSSTGRPKRAARSAAAPRRPGAAGHAVEQAHGDLDHQQVRAAAACRPARRAGRAASPSCPGWCRARRRRRRGRPGRCSRARTWRCARARRGGAGPRPGRASRWSCRRRSGGRDQPALGVTVHRLASAVDNAAPAPRLDDRRLRRGGGEGGLAGAADGRFPDPVEIPLPRGGRTAFALAEARLDGGVAAPRS